MLIQFNVASLVHDFYILGPAFVMCIISSNDNGNTNNDDRQSEILKFTIIVQSKVSPYYPIFVIFCF